MNEAVIVKGVRGRGEGGGRVMSPRPELMTAHSAAAGGSKGEKEEEGERRRRGRRRK